ncbi:MAG: ankyrin repeat domain-containing protein [Chlamydiales bacterium]|nr:ankyrin repeat domain-containing protein [Chlamydiales bacterium]
MAVTPIWETEKLSALFVVASQNKELEKRIEAFQEKGWEVSKVCVKTLRELENHLKNTHPKNMNMQLWLGFKPKMKKPFEETLETICNFISPGGILVVENGKQNTLKILAANCRFGVFVLGANTSPPPNIPQCLGHLVYGMNATEIYCKTWPENIQNIDALQLEELWSLLGKMENTLPLCMRILGEEINLKTVKYVLGLIPIFLEDLEPFWQNVLKKMRDYKDGDHSQSYKDPKVLRSLIPRNYRCDHFLDAEWNRRSIDFGMNVLSCRPFEGAYLFVFSLAILDKYHPLISWLLEKLGDSEEIKMELIRAISGLAIRPTFNQLVWERMKDAIALVKNSYTLAEAQGTFDIWCYKFTRQREYSLSSYMKILKELHSRQLLRMPDASAFRERILPLHNLDGQLRFTHCKFHLFYPAYPWPIPYQDEKIVEKIKNDNSLTLDDQLQFICSLKDEHLVRESMLLTALVKTNYFEALPLFFSLIANHYETPLNDSPLHVAVLHKHTQSLKELLALQADPNIKDREKKTPLDCALKLGWEEGVQILRETGGVTSLPKKEEFG